MACTTWPDEAFNGHTCASRSRWSTGGKRIDKRRVMAQGARVSCVGSGGCRKGRVEIRQMMCLGNHRCMVGSKRLVAH